MRVVVVGGGVIGLTTAYHLVRRGCDVVLLDARATGLGASAVNAGWFVPAEAMPIPGPGMMSQSLRWMLRADSPLYIRPSLNPAFWSFMVRMWRRCNAEDQRAGFEAHLRLAEDTAKVLDEYRADGIDFEMHQDGLLMAFTDQASLDHHVRSLDLVRRFGVDARVLLGDAVRVHEPLLADRVRGGIFFPGQRHLDPRALAVGLHRRLLVLGVQIHENQRVSGVRRAGRQVTAVTTSTAAYTADAYVLAAGAFTGGLSRLFGHALPIRAGKGYSIDLPAIPLRGPTNLSDAKVALTPFRDRLRLAGTMEFGRLDEQIDEVRVEAIVRATGGHLREWVPPAPAGRKPAGVGIRPMTPDGLPVIGRFPGLDNAFVSSGHGMLGVTLAAGSARAVTDLVVHRRPVPALAAFNPARF